MAEKKFYGVPVDDDKLLSQIQAHKPAGRYYDPFPLKGIAALAQVDPKEIKMYGKNPQGVDLLAGHAYADTEKVGINTNPNFLNNQYGTLVHEQQHILDDLRGGKTSEDVIKYEGRTPKYKNQGGESLYPFPRGTAIGDRYDDKKPSWVSAAEWKEYTNNKEKEIKNYLQELNDKYLDKYKLSADFPSGGTIAELRRIHETTPGGIMATDLGQDLFGKYPELQHAFFTRIRPENATSIMETPVDNTFIKTPIKESIPVEPNKSMVDKVRKYIKKATTYNEGGKIKLPDGYKSGGSSSLI